MTKTLLMLITLTLFVPPHWTVQTTGANVRLRGVSAVSESVAGASGAASTVLRTVDGGTTSQKLTITSDTLDFRDVDAVYAQTAYVLSIGNGRKPRPAPVRWRPLIGEYGRDSETVIILESDGKLCALVKGTELAPLKQLTSDSFEFDSSTARKGERVVFSRNRGKVTQVTIGTLSYQRKPLGPEEGANQLKIQPIRPVPTLIKEALTAQPPNETGDFLPTDLVELRKLDPGIKLEIRYATTNNLFGTVFYSQARAFLQRPAAQALVRVHRKLRTAGYGLVVHDGYRPWYVTKVFWDATPDDKKLFVADPTKGSRHNRGCAVDVTLYDLKTGKPVEMVSTYDETTDRAYPNYAGGTSLQRWHRDLLRSAMEAEGFTVYEAEWWHFDYKDWQKYRVGNVRFEQIGR